jgi:hypothetical protein
MPRLIHTSNTPGINVTPDREAWVIARALYELIRQQQIRADRGWPYSPEDERDAKALLHAMDIGPPLGHIGPLLAISDEDNRRRPARVWTRPLEVKERPE